MIKLFNNYLTILIITFFLLSLPFNGKAEVIEVVTELLEPYQIKNPDGSLGGFSTDVVEALFKITEDHPKIQVMPWARAYDVALHNPNVLIYSIAHTKLRNKKFHWIGALKEERLYFWGLKKHYPKTNYKVSALKNRKIAVSRNSNSAQYLIAQDFSNIYQLANERQTMNMLFIDRVDLILATQITIETRAKNLGYDFNELQRLNEVAALNNKLSIAFSLNTSPTLIKKYQTAFQQLVTTGQLAKIKEKWKLD
ncbi:MULTISPECIES: ABC transporter substrate-binding protein [unclassified Colwellia]|uniref:substrate-binding periplasmic protein n=1 Tax=unclassified Colwellia TaxID=196834 RepID=UPI0015F64667|nr:MULTISPECIES: transporter substrate-binding domain-containing protein [unclassified Colwellia]MBA6378796.1 transporter substrate-binding domain-containing protein [Colwellia sp. BRX10-7]MBA6386933.1 transporter substrate-binding domain-containing protein [Colwellia sp. BRX10-2]MBA6401302.1 transporter substrate-binding domain-containing protein [Colwellia sp. BRX10-5]MBA6404464.1 transporter substrate-binding domain-containing protein [Colwellia sp. BRX10-1]